MQSMVAQVPTETSTAGKAQTASVKASKGSSASVVDADSSATTKIAPAKSIDAEHESSEREGFSPTRDVATPEDDQTSGDKDLSQDDETNLPEEKDLTKDNAEDEIEVTDVHLVEKPRYPVTGVASRIRGKCSLPGTPKSGPSGTKIQKLAGDSDVFVPEVDQYVSMAEINHILADDLMTHRNQDGRNVTAFKRVKQFNANLNFYKEDSNIKFNRAVIDEKDFIFSVFYACRLFNADPVNNPMVINEGKLEAYQVINDGVPISPNGYLQNTALNFSNRMLHKVVMSCLASRVRSIDSVMPRDWNLMVHLENGIPENLRSIVFSLMASSIKDESMVLPFAHVITAMLKFYGDDVKPLNKMDVWTTQVIGANSVDSMGFQFVNDAFVKKPSRREIAAFVCGKAASVEKQSMLSVRRWLVIQRLMLLPQSFGT
ncbi:hypothetical protein MLD38_006568 [Melastoma candidum]|uniref:Uncharacterized protein n=1 Tax=Melastoma candidum TaxID=119954 RepID=A0ACB9RMV4_9MYRT|nr:hypothetical protein MLD38_006568 [Melastoma candidum]